MNKTCYIFCAAAEAKFYADVAYLERYYLGKEPRDADDTRDDVEFHDDFIRMHNFVAFKRAGYAYWQYYRIAARDKKILCA